MLNIIKKILLQLINDIDSGNSNLSLQEQLEVVDLLQKLSRQELSKIESANYIGVSRATFDNYINKGLIPKGLKRQGFKELFWNKHDLNKYLNEKC